ncbi:MAG: hypothetical protein U9R66_14045 [Thermodesulfobacteriota bacterium]|nr:hypothetical protein [Thermodesulfobacteriota bacterium]
MTNKIQTKIEYPINNSLDRNCKWGRPAFEAYNGLCEASLWELNGLPVALGFIDDERHSIIGSGIMVAPGLCLTATHVIEETKSKCALIHSFANEEKLQRS